MTNQCDDVAKVAEGLTDRQREAFLSAVVDDVFCSDCGFLYNDSDLPFAPLDATATHNSPDHQSGDYAGGTVWQWTPLGNAVSAHLQQKGSSHD